jgi:hypothetical protein
MEVIDLMCQLTDDFVDAGYRMLIARADLDCRDEAKSGFAAEGIKTCPFHI